MEDRSPPFFASRTAEAVTLAITSDALDALGRTEEARALREKYGITPEG
jgi:hypothetical protein